MKPYRIIKGSPEFKEMLKEVKAVRFKIGKDEKLLSDRRLTISIVRIPNLKERLIEAEIRGDI